MLLFLFILVENEVVEAHFLDLQDIPVCFKLKYNFKNNREENLEENYLTINIANHCTRIYADNFKPTNSNNTEIKKGNFSDVLNSKLSNTKTDNLDRIFERAAVKHNVPVNLLKAVAKAESGFNPIAESKAGAQGIMQLMPATAKSLGVTNSFDTEQNIMGGAKYLRQMLDKFHDNTELSLAAYNAGPGNVLKYNGIPPFNETQNYVTKVMGYCGQHVSSSLGTDPFNIGSTNTEILNSNTYNAGLLNLDANSNYQTDELLQILQGTDLSEILTSDDVDAKNYALMMDLYLYKAQLSMFNNELDSEII